MSHSNNGMIACDITQFTSDLGTDKNRTVSFCPQQAAERTERHSHAI
ncbi:protein of unknown function [Streptomyces sp. KY75]|nr:protein of unknown function [Streptomyces sp. KY75]CAD5990120.1 protein of unknown function [Streptomyces sp. KY70]